MVPAPPAFQLCERSAVLIAQKSASESSFHYVKNATAVHRPEHGEMYMPSVRRLATTTAEWSAQQHSSLARICRKSRRQKSHRNP